MDGEHWKIIAKQIDECKYLYVRGLHEPRDNRIRFLVEEAGLGAQLLQRPDDISRRLRLYSRALDRLNRTPHHDCLRLFTINTSPIRCPTKPTASIPNFLRFLQGIYSEFLAGLIC
jgi:hypothetical protein